MIKRSSNSEEGQAIVYLVIGMVVFLGFVAMAIDGGRVLADRRHEQNAADAASLAGGGQVATDMEDHYINDKNWNCTNYSWLKNNAEVAAYHRADANGYAITYNLDSDLPGSPSNYVVATCANKYIDITVDIVVTSQSNFLQLVFPNALTNKVDSITRVYPRHPTSPGNAIVALNSDTCNGNQNGGIFWMNQQDSSTLNVYNGSIFSNGCIKCNGSPNINVTCDGDPNCNPGSLGSFGEYPPETCNGTWTPAPTSPVDQLDPTDFTGINPDCSKTSHNLTSTQFENLFKNKTYTLDAGLWCVNGDVTINKNDVLLGDNVTIVINGSLNIAGGGQVNLTADDDTHASPQIPGVLFYIPEPNPFDPARCSQTPAWRNVSIEGTSTTTLTGSIVAPCSTVSLLGTGNNKIIGQVVGWNVVVGGNASLGVTYNANMTASSPTSLKLYK